MDWNIKPFLNLKKKFCIPDNIFLCLSLYEREIHAIKDKKHLCGILEFQIRFLVSDLSKTLLPQYKRSVFCFWSIFDFGTLTDRVSRKSILQFFTARQRSFFK